MCNVPRAPMESDGNSRFCIQKVARPSGTNLQLAAETWEFTVPSLSMGARGTLMYLNLTFMN